MLLTLDALRSAYRQGQLSPRELVERLQSRADELAPAGVWIYRLSLAELEPYLQALEGESPDTLPLYGVPFVIKDNIDLAGIPTTAACAEAAYTPENSAVVVQLLLEAGALPMAKTNLDQFATGLVGTRSPEPWGPCSNAFDPSMISGGSSAGSAVAVALGLASFSLGTDTAGSGRVPAAFNNLVGLKPSRGVLSSRGMIPACRSLDTISLFTLIPEDAERLFDLVAVPDREDPYSRSQRDSVWPGLAACQTVRIAAPPSAQLEFDDDENRSAFSRALETLDEQGFEILEADFEPFLDAARLLYEGPWVAERTLALDALMGGNTEVVHEVVAGIIEGGRSYNAMQTYSAQYQLEALRRQAKVFFERVDFAITPTTPGIRSIAEVLKDPVALNSRLGYYTNFMNLLDLAAVAVPAGFLPSRLPFGITLFGPAGSDRALLRLARRYLDAQDLPLGATGCSATEANGHLQDGRSALTCSSPDWIELAVCGAHLSGCALNHQLTDRKARLVAKTKTAACYRLYCLPGDAPARPALVCVADADTDTERSAESGAAIDVETWALPANALASFIAGIPAPLAIGKVALETGRSCAGFVCEQGGVAGAADITHFGGWRQYLASLN